jgi:hypothetical protein
VAAFPSWGWPGSYGRQFSSETGLPLPICRRSPLQGPHGFDCIGCRVAHPARNRLVVEALHVLLRRNAESRGFAAKQGEFASRDVGADLLDYAVMIDQGFGDPAIKRWLRQIPKADFLRAPFCGRRCSRCDEVEYWDQVLVFQPLPHLYTICGALSSSIRARVGKTGAIVPV